MTTLSDMAPAIGGAVFGVAMWLYALHIRHKLREERRRGTPAE